MRYSTIRKEWNGSPVSGKANISHSQRNAEACRTACSSKEESNMAQNYAVTFSRHSRTSRSTRTSEHSTSLHESSHYRIVATIATRKTITKKQAPSQTMLSQPLQRVKAHSISNRHFNLLTAVMIMLEAPRKSEKY